MPFVPYKIVKNVSFKQNRKFEEYLNRLKSIYISFSGDTSLTPSNNLPIFENSGMNFFKYFDNGKINMGRYFELIF